MRPMRSAGGGFGLPQVTTMAARLMIALVVGSVVAALSSTAASWLLLDPSRFLTGFALWQPLSYAFIEVSPLGVVFGALIIWVVGGALEATWGPRRLLKFALGAPVLAGVLTAVLALGIDRLNRPFAGGSVLTISLWVTYGLSFGRAQTYFWGIPMTGNVLALVGVGFVVLNAVFAHWSVVVPDFIGIAIAYFYVRGPSPRHLLLRFQSWRFQRQLRARSSHLRVVGKDRNISGGSDRYLH